MQKRDCLSVAAVLSCWLEEPRASLWKWPLRESREPGAHYEPDFIQNIIWHLPPWALTAVQGRDNAFGLSVAMSLPTLCLSILQMSPFPSAQSVLVKKGLLTEKIEEPQTE